MTTKRSSFGSLEQRMAGQQQRGQAPAPSTDVVRHVWLDGTTPGLVTARRRDASGNWEGYVLHVTGDGFVTHEWVPGTRITAVVTR